MTLRRVLWVAIPLLLVAALAGLAGIAWLLLRGQAAPIRLIAVGGDTRVRLIDMDGERLLADDASDDSSLNFAFPAPTPDGRGVVYVAEADGSAAIIHLDLDSGERRELYRSNESYPYDLAWSPDGKYVVFLAGSPLTLHIVPADGSKAAQAIATGQPSFFAWSADSSTLLLHVEGHSVQNGHLVAYTAASERSTTLLSDPGLFQAPAWSLDGKHFFYAAQPPITKPQPELEDIASNIVRVDADGKDPVTLVAEQAAYVWMVRSPISDRIAYIARSIAEDTNATLKLIDGAGGEARTLSRSGESVTAFFWSPDGTRIAYLTHEGANQSDSARVWHIVDVDGGAVRDFEPFQPSAAFIGLQAYFDAYTFTFSPWSPDGSRIVYGAEDGLYVLDVAAGRAFRAGDGGLGVWVGGK
jgi:TolB protein